MQGFKFCKKNMKKFNLKNIKTWNSRNGYGMNATLVIDNVSVCVMNDIGEGSQPSFDIIDQNLFNQLQAKIEELPEIFVEQYECELKIDLCMFIDILHYALESKTEFKLLAA